MRRRAAFARSLVLLIALALPAEVRAVNLEVPVGPRAIGMAGAFSAIADDATAPFWNAAGLPWIEHQELGASHADLYGTQVLQDYASFVLPLSRMHAAALDFYHSGFSDSELDFGESRIDLSFGQRFLEHYSAGATLKYVGRHTNLDGFTVRQGAGVGLDLGLMARPFEWLRLSGVAQDVFDTKVTYSQGDGTVTAYPRSLRVGAAWTPIRNGVLAMDVDDHVHVGAEYSPLGPVTLRAGVEDDPGGLDGHSLDFGVGLRWGTFRVDYALEDHSTLGSTSHFGLGVEFNFNPSQIRIEHVAANDLYTSLYRSYTTAPIGSLKVKNLEGQPIRADVRVMVPGLMREPSSQEVVLRPHATQDVPLTAVLGDQVMARTGDRPVQVEVTATYQSLRLPRTEKATARATAYGPGAIDWHLGLDQAAAWVTTRDPVVEAVARRAVHSAPDSGGIGIRNLDFAIAVFDAVEVLGVAYVPDPNNPYATISGAPRAVDTIFYPRETLARLSGDCDDTSVLFAALLGNVGIRTQFVGVPGHIFLLVAADVSVRNRMVMGLDESLVVVDHGEVWIPLETTALGKGFAAAWRSGAEAYSSWAPRGRAELVDVSGAQLKYQPGELEGAPATPALDESRLATRVRDDQRTIGGWRSEFLATRYAGLRDSLTTSAAAMNEMAHVYLLAGDQALAADALAKALVAEPRSARTLNNQAVVSAARGDLEGASAQLRASLASEAEDPGPWLNLGLVRDASGDSAGAEVALDHGISLSGGYAGACAVLGIPPADPAGSLEGTKRMTAEEARDLLKSALKRVPAAPRVPADTSRVAKPRVWNSRVAGGRSAEHAELSDLLYWKR